MILFAFLLGACAGTRVHLLDQPLNPEDPAALFPSFRYGAGLTLRALDPNGAAGWCEVTALIHARLFTVDGRGRVVGDLVEGEPEINEDRLRWRLRLRQGTVFHDGSPVRAADVEATFTSLGAQEASELRSLLRPVRALRALGEHEIEILVAHPFPELPEVLTEMAVLPEAAGSANPGAPAPGAVGAGPYRLVRQEGDHVLFEAHRAYHLGTPRLSRLELRVIEDDRARARALARGELDLACIKPESQDLLGDRRRFRLHRFPSGVIRAMPLELSAPGLEDPRVRRALGALVDREALVRDALGGLGRPAYQILAPGSPAFDRDLDRPWLSPGEAHQVLEEAGYRRDAGGKLRRNGQPLQARLVAWQGEAFRRRAAELVAASWEKAGVEVTILRVDHEGYTDLARNLRGQAEAYIGGWGALLAPATVLSRKFSREGGQNRTGFSDSEVEELLARAAAEPRLGGRVEAVRQAQRRLRELMPWIPLAYPDLLFASSVRVEGLDFELVDSWYEFPRHLWRVGLTGASSREVGSGAKAPPGWPGRGWERLDGVETAPEEERP